MKFSDTVDKLQEIVNIHYQHKQQQEQENQAKINSPSSNLVKQAASLFIKIREDKGLFKIPGTSEFLDWLDALYCFSSTNPNSQKPPYPLKELEEGKPIPYRELIFKIRQDWQKNTSFPQVTS